MSPAVCLPTYCNCLPHYLCVLTGTVPSGLVKTFIPALPQLGETGTTIPTLPVLLVHSLPGQQLPHSLGSVETLLRKNGCRPIPATTRAATALHLPPPPRLPALLCATGHPATSSRALGHYHHWVGQQHCSVPSTTFSSLPPRAAAAVLTLAQRTWDAHPRKFPSGLPPRLPYHHHLPGHSCHPNTVLILYGWDLPQIRPHTPT